jgi:hypothetical protein
MTSRKKIGLDPVNSDFFPAGAPGSLPSSLISSSVIVLVDPAQQWSQQMWKSGRSACTATSSRWKAC